MKATSTDINHAPGIVIYKKHDEACKGHEKCACPRYLKWRIFPNGKDGKPEQKFYGQYSKESQELAERELRQRRGEIQRGELTPILKTDRLTFPEGADIFYELYGSCKVKGTYVFKHSLDLWKVYLKDRWLDEVSADDVEDFREIQEERVSPATVNKYHMVLTRMFSCLKRWKGKKDKSLLALTKGRLPRLPEENPGSLVAKANEKSRRRTRVLSQAEFKALVGAAPDDFKWVLKLALYTLLRKKDLANLTPDSFNPLTGSLKGIQAKTAHPFEIPVGSDCCKYIEQRLVDMEDFGKNHFYNDSQDKLLNFTNFRKIWLATTETAGFWDTKNNLPTIEFRDLRRTGATWLYQDGEKLDVISQMLGHTSILMTEVYIGLDREKRQMAATKMDALVRQALVA